MKTDLSKFTVGDYQAGPKWKVFFWYFVNYYIFDSAFPWPYNLKRGLLKLFGAKVGAGLIIKTKVRIKNPWRLKIGDHCWIGESVWIDNLENVTMGSNVCLSQGAMLLTGNHDYAVDNFPYRLGARSIVCPGVVCKAHAILTVNSVATKHLDESGIYSGNPATFIRSRKISDN
jgi:putative colanic acid biosynthesis acetyltransferase WcaF